MNRILMFHLVAFILGSIPCGYLLGKMKGVDIRDHGSGNIGATNIARVMGKFPGLIILIADFAKGLLAVLLVHLLPASTQVLSAQSFAASLGLCAIIGHCYSPFMRFNGGKGVATGLGVFLLLTPIPALVAVGIFILSLKIFNYISLSSILAAATIPIAYAVLQENNGMIMTVAVTAACIVMSRHKANIYRIREGTEPKLNLLQEQTT